MESLEVIGFGAMNLDLVYRVERILSDGETTVEGFTAAPGGSAANTVYGLARLGTATGFIGAVGNDDAGKKLLDDFESAGVDSSHVQVKKKAATGSALCLTDPTGKRALYVSPGANSLLDAPDTDIDYLNRAGFVHMSSFTGQKQFEVQQQIVSNLAPSVKLSFAPGELYAAKGLDTLSPMLSRTHILFLNRNELEQLTGEGLEKGARLCLERGCNMVAVTLGRGLARQGKTITCYLSDGEQDCMIESVPSRAQKTLETTGAGDAFAAGVLYGLLRGKGLQDCGILGEIMARFCIEKTGSRAGLPTPEELAVSYRKRTGSTLHM